tara:strand:+ start:1966 stop:2175 length:210 start_codon:yes stop_codon:yes gene_type:complete
MFTPESFEMPLEAQLKLRVVTDEIKQCKDVKVLQDGLIATSELVARYQQILAATIKEVIEHEIDEINNS